MPTAAHAAVLQMRSLPGSPPNGVDYVDGCVPDGAHHVERLPGLRAGGRVAQRIHATRAGVRTGETGNAAGRTALERWPAGHAALATFSAHRVSNGYPGTNDPGGGLVRHIGAWLAFAEACPPVSSSGSVEGRELSLRAPALARATSGIPGRGNTVTVIQRPQDGNFRRFHEPLSGSLNSNGCRTSCRTRRPPRIAGV